MAQKHGLGRGLGALIRDAGGEPEEKTPAATGADGVQQLPLTAIRKNPFQPRQIFDPDGIDDLTRSVTEHGILQPVLVRPVSDGYELIAGERRFLAARKAELSSIPAIVRDMPDDEALAVALIENLQRENLNVIEEADGYQQLAEKFSMTQEQIAKKVGKARATVANVMRLLSLPEAIRRMVKDDDLSAGHAKVLLGVDDKDDQLRIAERATKEGLSVRALEKVVDALGRPPRKPRARKTDVPAAHVEYVTDALQRHFGTKVRVSPSSTLANGKKAHGAIEIEYYSNEDLDRILEVLGLVEDA